MKKKDAEEEAAKMAVLWPQGQQPPSFHLRAAAGTAIGSKPSSPSVSPNLCGSIKAADKALVRQGMVLCCY